MQSSKLQTILQLGNWSEWLSEGAQAQIKVREGLSHINLSSFNNFPNILLLILPWHGKIYCDTWFLCIALKSATHTYV